MAPSLGRQSFLLGLLWDHLGQTPRLSMALGSPRSTHHAPHTTLSPLVQRGPVTNAAVRRCSVTPSRLGTLA